MPYELYAAIAGALATTLFARADCGGALAALRQLGERCDSPLAHLHADLLDAWLALTDADGALLTPGQLLRGGGPQALAKTTAQVQRALAAILAEGSAYLTFAVPHILAPLCAHALAAGVATDAARALIRAYRLMAPHDVGGAWPRPVQLRVFGHFELLLDGAPLPTQRKSKHRQLDVLKLVAAHAPDGVSLDRAAELLWPDTDGDGARNALETTLSRLRATIGSGSIVLQQGVLSLGPQQCWCDAAALEVALPLLLAQTPDGGLVTRQGYVGAVRNEQRSERRNEQRSERRNELGDAARNEARDARSGDDSGRAPAHAAPVRASARIDHAALLTAAERVMGLYRGELLAGDGAPWLLVRRELWRARVVRALGGAGRALAAAGHSAAAAQLLDHALDADPAASPLPSS